MSGVSSSDEKRRIKHDIMAPLCNIRAFSEELKYATESLEQFIDKNADVLPDNIRNSLRQYIEEDVRICGDAIERASGALTHQLDVLFEHSQYKG